VQVVAFLGRCPDVTAFALADLVGAVRGARRADARAHLEDEGSRATTVEEHLDIMRRMRDRIADSGDVPDIDADLDRFRDGLA
jgi:hypothetical protein